MYKIKKWAEANFKRSGIERKTKPNTIGWNARLILSLRAQKNCNFPLLETSYVKKL